MRFRTSTIIGCLLACLLFVLCSSSFAFNHSLRGEHYKQTPNFKKMYSQPIQKPTNVNQEPVSVSEGSPLVFLGTGVVALILLRKRNAGK